MDGKSPSANSRVEAPAPTRKPRGRHGLVSNGLSNAVAPANRKSNRS